MANCFVSALLRTILLNHEGVGPSPLLEERGVRLVTLHSIMSNHVLMNHQGALFYHLLRLLQFSLSLNCMGDHRGDGSGMGKLVFNLTNPFTDRDFRMGSSCFVSALL